MEPPKNNTPPLTRPTRNRIRINRGLETKLAQKFGGNSFSMGGLAGFPFGGVTSFGAFAHHIPNPGE